MANSDVSVARYWPSLFLGVVLFLTNVASAQHTVLPVLGTHNGRIDPQENNEVVEDVFLNTPDERKLFIPGGGRKEANDNVQIGFSFLRPDWARDGFQTLVDAATATALGLPGELVVDNFDWQPELNFGFEMQGAPIFNKEVLLTGNRTATSGKVTQVVGGRETTTTANVDVINVGFGPAPKEFTSEWDKLAVGIQTRYLEIGQNFDSSFENGSMMEAALSATGRFKGVGIGVSADYTYFLLPLTSECQYGLEFITGVDVNGSMGSNDRTSTISAETGTAATSFVNTVKKESTDFVYGGEAYMGLRFLFDVEDQDIEADAGKDRKFWLDTVAYGNYWANVGLLNPRDTGVSDNDLFVYGFLIVGGMYY